MSVQKAGFRTEVKDFFSKHNDGDFDSLKNNYEKSRWMTKAYLELILRVTNPGIVPEDKDDLNECYVDGSGDTGVDFI